MDCACEGVYSRAEQACGERESGSSGRKMASWKESFQILCVVFPDKPGYVVAPIVAALGCSCPDSY
jgi:hypothetical protein